MFSSNPPANQLLYPSDDWISCRLFLEQGDVTATNNATERAIGEFPIYAWAVGDNFHAYLRQIGDQVLTFGLEGGGLVNEETSSTGGISRGLASA